MKKSFPLGFGAVAGIAQAGSAAIVQLLALRILIDSSSMDALGLWALATALCAPIRMADVAGLATSYFVARAGAQSHGNSTALSIQICAATSLALLCISATALALILPLGFGVLVPHGLAGQVAPLIPYVMLSTVTFTWGNGLATNFDGLHKSHFRSAILAVGNVSFLGTVVLAVPANGVIGMAIAQFVQGVTAALLSLGGLSRKFPLFQPPPQADTMPLLREIVHYGARQQGFSAIQALFEPAMRVLISNFGGLAALATYEVAQRVVGQGRAMALQSLYPIIPAMTHLYHADKQDLGKLLSRVQLWCTLAAVAALPIALIFSPAVSRLVIGHSDTLFDKSFSVLLIPALFAIASFPLLYLGPATANFRWNTISQLLALVLLILVGIALNSNFSVNAVIMLAAALATSATGISCAGNAMSARIPIASSMLLLASALAALLATRWLFAGLLRW